MRRSTVSILAMVGFSTVLGGCNCAGRAFEVRRTFHVHAGATDPLCQTDRLQVALGEDKAFVDAKAFISTVELRKLEVAITDPKTSGDSVVTKGNGKVRIAEALTGSAIELGTYGDVPVAAGSRKEIAFDPAAAKSMGQLALRAPNTFYLEAEGCNDAVPAWYDFEVILTMYAGL